MCRPKTAFFCIKVPFLFRKRPSCSEQLGTKNSLRYNFWAGTVLGHQGSRRRDIPDPSRETSQTKTLCKAPFGAKSLFDSFGPREQRSPKSLLHHPNPLLHRCNPILHQCKRPLARGVQKTFCTLSFPFWAISQVLSFPTLV